MLMLRTSRHASRRRRPVSHLFFRQLVALSSRLLCFSTVANAVQTPTQTTTKKSFSATEQQLRADIAKIRPQRLVMPTKLSPTAATNMMECEQRFLFRNLWKLQEPPSAALVKGNLVHEVLEKVYLKPIEERTETELQSMLRTEWLKKREAQVSVLFADEDEERAWGLDCFRILKNYIEYENPMDPQVTASTLRREEWLSATIPTNDGLPELKLLGKLDRVDAVDGSCRVVDYKTGASPESKGYYGEALVAKLRESALFQLRAYALMLDRMKVEKYGDLASAELRLLYLGGEKAAVIEDTMTQAKMDDVQEKLVGVWAKIHERVSDGDISKFTHCEHKWCFCHTVRPLLDDDNESSTDDAVEETVEASSALAAAVMADLMAPPLPVEKKKQQPVVLPDTASDDVKTDPAALKKLKVAQLKVFCDDDEISTRADKYDPTGTKIIGTKAAPKAELIKRILDFNK